MQMNEIQANMIARDACVRSGVNMLQQIYANTLTSGIAGTVINVPVQNVGLIKRFIVELSFTVARSAAETQTRTSYGPANCLSSVVFTDLSNQTRIQTAGWHLHNVATVSTRRLKRLCYGAAFTNDSPVDFGANFDVISAPASFTTGNQTVKMMYEVPLSYNDNDLRGAVFASVVNATMNLQLTINANFFVASTADETLAVYQSSSADLGTISACTIKVYQEYLDQLPQGDKGPLLPLLDLATAYMLQNTVATGLAVGQDLAIPYANFRDFMSTFVIYDNAGVLNVGTDLNYLALQTANYTNILKYDPFISALLTREIVADDVPPGTYYFDHRRRPISTIQYGNQQLILNPSSVGAGASVLVGYEMLALINQIAQAGSLYNT